MRFLLSIIVGVFININLLFAQQNPDCILQDTSQLDSNDQLNQDTSQNNNLDNNKQNILNQEHEQHKDQKKNNSINKSGKNFKLWLSELSKNEFGNTGLGILIRNINGVVNESVLNSWLDSISEAAKSYPLFCNTGNEQKDREEFAAFLMIVGAETSFNTANLFPCTVEIGCPNCQACSYSDENDCIQNDQKQYFGRGPLQLSWKANYKQFSLSYFKDERLVDNPNLLTQSDTICWASAIWFWMNDQQDYGGWCMPQAAWSHKNQCDKDCYNGPSSCQNQQCTADHWMDRKKQSCHNAIHKGQGIGQVINIINGGYDCCPSSTLWNTGNHTVDRIASYLQILKEWAKYSKDSQDTSPLKNDYTIQIQDCPVIKEFSCRNNPKCSTY